MELQSARQIIDTLAQGVHPVTGEAMPQDSPYNAAPVIRALFAVSRALEEAPARSRRPAPANAGKPWQPQDDSQLVAGFDGGTEVPQLALELARTRYAVQARLVKLGKMPPRGDVPFRS
ncbi:MAG: hypothetical protein HYX47_10975 [Burkholderiales bacterium]|nr:hypothetical protein [Burkholderiales bacterium]